MALHYLWTLVLNEYREKGYYIKMNRYRNSRVFRCNCILRNEWKFKLINPYFLWVLLFFKARTVFVRCFAIWPNGDLEQWFNIFQLSKACGSLLSSYQRWAQTMNVSRFLPWSRPSEKGLVSRRCVVLVQKSSKIQKKSSAGCVTNPLAILND